MFCVRRPAIGANPSYNISASGSVGGKRDYRGEQIIEQRSASPVDTNREVNQKLTALTKALSDATTLLKTAGISTGENSINEIIEKCLPGL